MNDKNTDILKFYETEKIRNYLLKYIDELKLHFDVEQEDLEKILYECYKSIKAPTTVMKIIDMVKSLNKF